MRLKIPPPVYALMTVLLMWWLHTTIPVYVTTALFVDVIGWLFVIVGVLIELWSVGLFWKDNTTINPMRPENTNRLVVRGIYQYSRNPMYLGMACLLTGVALILGSLTPCLGVVMFVTLITVWQIRPDEISLEHKFGQEYLDYKRQVRRWL